MHDVRPEIHAPAAFERRARQHQEAAMLVGVAGVERGRAYSASDSTRYTASARTRAGRAPDVHAIFVAARPDAQALQRFDARGAEIVALDLRDRTA
jgi:hypothetical protein